VVVTLGIAATANATPITVPGTSNPWLAGMPDGTEGRYGDFAPFQSPVEIAVSPGQLLHILATGLTDHCPAGGCGLAGPDGDLPDGIWSHAEGDEHGLSDIVVPIDALIGVFLGPGQPDASAAPSALDFSSDASRDFASLSPSLKQMFFIGDGRRSDGITLQTFVVPDGATRLFLGTMDGYEWNNNSGSLEVTVSAVPEPATLTLVGGGLVLAMRRRRQRRPSQLTTRA